MSAPLEALSLRRPWLVMGIVGLVVDGDGEVSEDEIGDVFSVVPWSTVARVLRELASFGVLHRVGSQGQRRWRVTVLGRAWVDREVGPWPWPERAEGTHHE